MQMYLFNKARFQMDRDSKILLNCLPLQERTHLIMPLSYCGREAFFRGEIHVMYIVAKIIKFYTHQILSVGVYCTLVPWCRGWGNVIKYSCTMM